MMENSMTRLKTMRPPKRSVRMPNGMRPSEPRSTGIAMAMLFCTGVSAMCLLMIGIIADMEPKTAKQRATHLCRYDDAKPPREEPEGGKEGGKCARAESELKPGRRLRVHVRFPLR